jgi:hypothetical protein
METTFKWVDYILHNEQFPHARVAPPEEPSKAENEWPTPDAILQDTTVLPKQHGLNKQNESDRGLSVVRATTREIP